MRIKKLQFCLIICTCHSPEPPFTTLTMPADTVHPPKEYTGHTHPCIIMDKHPGVISDCAVVLFQPKNTKQFLNIIDLLVRIHVLMCFNMSNKKPLCCTLTHAHGAGIMRLCTAYMMHVQDVCAGESTYRCVCSSTH